MGLILYKYNIKNKFFRCYYPPFLCLQGIISYLSDSLFIRKPHWSHSIDKSFAAYNSISGAILSTYYNLNSIEQFIFFLGFIIKPIDTYYWQNNNIKMYTFTHILWHSILPGLSAYVVYTNPHYE